MNLHFGDIYVSKVIITIEEGIDVGVRETSIRGEGVDRWVVRGVFRAVFRGVFLSKPGKSMG